jgi:hypothetical protein
MDTLPVVVPGNVPENQWRKSSRETVKTVKTFSTYWKCLAGDKGTHIAELLESYKTGVLKKDSAEDLLKMLGEITRAFREFIPTFTFRGNKHSRYGELCHRSKFDPTIVVANFQTTLVQWHDELGALVAAGSSA